MTAAETGSRIASLRNQKGLTQKELAELCHVDIRTIQRIESGEVVPRKHTLRLLSATLGFDPGDLNTDPVNTEKIPGKSIRLALIAGLIFSINAIPVVVDLITGSLGTTAHIITVVIHITSCIFFYRGFYLLGKQYRNQVMEISFLLLMILLPLINVMELLKPWYFNSQVTATVFTFLCASVILSGTSILSEIYKRREYLKHSYYKIGGVAMIIEGTMFLSTDFNIVSAGLILSLISNLLLIMILYAEYTTAAKKDSYLAEEVFA